jgi:hypothetical protein
MSRTRHSSQIPAISQPTDLDRNPRRASRRRTSSVCANTHQPALGLNNLVPRCPSLDWRRPREALLAVDTDGMCVPHVVVPISDHLHRLSAPPAHGRLHMRASLLRSRHAPLAGNELERAGKVLCASRWPSRGTRPPGRKIAAVIPDSESESAHPAPANHAATDRRLSRRGHTRAASNSSLQANRPSVRVPHANRQLRPARSDGSPRSMNDQDETRTELANNVAAMRQFKEA